jgi:hypothetical protein
VAAEEADDELVDVPGRRLGEDAEADRAAAQKQRICCRDRSSAFDCSKKASLA